MTVPILRICSEQPTQRTTTISAFLSSSKLSSQVYHYHSVDQDRLWKFFFLSLATHTVSHSQILQLCQEITDVIQISIDIFSPNFIQRNYNSCHKPWSAKSCNHSRQISSERNEKLNSETSRFKRYFRSFI